MAKWRFDALSCVIGLGVAAVATYVVVTRWEDIYCMINPSDCVVV